MKVYSTHTNNTNCYLKSQTMEDLLYGPRVMEAIIKKPEFSFLNKFYCLLYQSLIPNCSLTIKTLRQEHLNISHSVQQYILSGDGRRLRCQRLINFLLVHLDNVKDYSQFCHYLNLVTIITDLPYRMIAEFHMNGQWGRSVPHHPKLNQQKISEAISNISTNLASGGTKLRKDIHSFEECARDENLNVEVISDDEASIEKAYKISISIHYSNNSRRRHVVIMQKVTTEELVRNTEVTSNVDTKVTMIGQRPSHMPISLDLDFMLSSSEWSIVDTFFSPLCDCLPRDYYSTIEKLKSFPQFAGVEHQQQLKSLIPATLTEINVINEKILTFLVMNLCYDANRAGITRLCDVMEQLIEFSGSTSCIQEIRFAVNNDSVNSPSAESPSQPTDSLHQACNAGVVSSTPAVPVSSSNDGGPVTEVINVYTADTVSSGVSLNSATDVTDCANIPGLQLLLSRYQVILQSLPMDFENTLNLLQNYLTDAQLCQILSSPNYNTANKAILDCLIEKFKESVDVSELCKKLELIASLSTSKLLSDVVSELKIATSTNSTQRDEQSEELELPKILTVSEDFVQLKTHYHTILHLMPADYEQSIGRLQNHFTDEQICTILYCSSCTTANKLILDCLIERMSCKEDQLDFCAQLEKIAAASNELKIIIQEIRSGVDQAQALDTHQQSGMISDSFGVMYNMAFSDLRLNPDSKVVAVLQANYNGLCSCLPKDSLVTIKRIKQTVPSAVELVEDHLIALPPDHANAMITVIFIKRLHHEADVLSMCDIYEGIVDDGAPKKFIYTLRSELIEALSTITEDAGYFDRLIFSHMSGFSNSKVLAILKKHCLRLCQCLPEDYMKTLERIRRRATVPKGLVQQLASLPTPTQVNHYIVGAMLRPLTNESSALGFCDTIESVLDDEQSKAFIESIRNEICETLSLPADVVTTNIATTTVTITTATVSTTVANTINIIQNFIPLPSTVDQLTADQKPSEASSSSETPTNTNDNGEVT